MIQVIQEQTASSPCQVPTIKVVGRTSSKVTRAVTHHVIIPEDEGVIRPASIAEIYAREMPVILPVQPVANELLDSRLWLSSTKLLSAYWNAHNYTNCKK